MPNLQKFLYLYIPGIKSELITLNYTLAIKYFLRENVNIDTLALISYCVYHKGYQIKLSI